MKKHALWGVICALAFMGASCQNAPSPKQPSPAETNANQTVDSVNASAQPIEPELPAMVNTNDQASVPTVPAAPPQSQPQQSVPVTKTFDLKLTKFEFNPRVLEVNVGDTVIINATAVDTTHGLSLPDFKVNLVIPQGTMETATFVADKAGTYTFRCSVYCGAGHSSMTGTLIVK